MSTRRAPTGPLAAYVLHSYDWSETSLIVDLFTRERGRVIVAAKGAKRPYSQLRPVLLPFHALLVQLGRTPADEAAEVLNLRSAEWAGGAPTLPSSALFSAFYCNELVMKLLARQDPNAALFDAYADTLAALPDEATALRAFELMLLRHTGVLPELDIVTQTVDPVQSDRRYGLHPEAGVVPDPQGLPGSAWVLIEAGLAAGDGALLRAACAPVAPALRTPLRRLLDYHLGASPLRTRQVMRDVQKLVS